MMRALLSLALVGFLVGLAGADIPILRFASNPIVNQTNMGVQCDGSYDVNFPSIVSTPGWLKERLEPILGYGPAYLMYYSNHHGQQIYLSYANKVEGPWVAYAPGTTLTLTRVLEVFNASTTNVSESAEVASPDIYIDNDSRLVRMYFHRRVPNDNFAILTSAAFAEDGIHFNDIFTPEIVTAYARHFEWQGYIYLTDRQGYLWRSQDGLTNLEQGPTTIGDAFEEPSLIQPGNIYTGYVRHLGLFRNGNVLYIYGTRVGDAPERVLWTTMSLEGNWLNWTAITPIQEGFRSNTTYEGANLPITPSLKGDQNALTPVHQLRDPFPFATSDRCYIFYTVAGEQGVAGAILPDSFCFYAHDDGHHKQDQEQDRNY